MDDGVIYAAVSQVAVDCLTGNGGMPAAGQAILQWMAANEDQWRLQNLPALDRPTALGRQFADRPQWLLSIRKVTAALHHAILDQHDDVASPFVSLHRVRRAASFAT